MQIMFIKSYNVIGQNFGSGEKSVNTDVQLQCADRFALKKETIFPLKEIKFKTTQLLYSNDYVPVIEPKEGYFRAYALDRESLKPIDIYVERISDNSMGAKNGITYNFYRTSNDKSLKSVGSCELAFNDESKKVLLKSMESKDKTLIGVGHLEYHSALSEMINMGYDNIKLEATQDSYDFHTKAGFKTLDSIFPMSWDRIENMILGWAKRMNAPEEKVKEMFVRADLGYSCLNLNKTYENLIIYMNKYGLKLGDQIRVDMELSPSVLKEWIGLVNSKLFFINKIKGLR